MNYFHAQRLFRAAVLCGLVVAPLACNRLFSAPPPVTKAVARPPSTQGTVAAAAPQDKAQATETKGVEPWPPAGAKLTELGPNIFLGQAGERRWVEIRAKTCLEQGYLEHLLSRDQASKHHESILSTKFDAFHLHGALLAAGAKAGHTVQFVNADGKPEFKPPTGDKIQITLRYKDKDGKEQAVPAQRWVRNAKTKKELDLDWVFAGSRFFKDQSGGPDVYGANDGRVITTANFITSILDLPIKSAEGDPSGGLEFEANTEHLPPRDTPVTVILEVKKDAPAKPKP
jgi:hypothetical protein